MGISYHGAENKVDKENRKKEKIKMLEETILSIIEDKLKNGLTEEQMFLTNYYGLSKEDILNLKFNLSDTSQIEDIKSNKTREQLEIDRYNELIDMYSTVENFDEKKINGYNDIFHKPIKDWDDYTREFEQDPLIVKKMRNLQMLNRMAHGYDVLLKKILYTKIPRLNRVFTENYKRIIENNVEETFSAIENDSKKAMQFLEKNLGKEQATKLKNDKIIEYCVNARKWMFSQKTKYLQEVLQDLQNTNGEYNYGVREDSFVFDVPGYGQLCVHMGQNNTQRVEELRMLYNVKDYEGAYLGNIFILSKADPELLKNVNEEKLSEENKQRYKIAKSRFIS